MVITLAVTEEMTYRLFEALFAWHLKGCPAERAVESVLGHEWGELWDELILLLKMGVIIMCAHSKRIMALCVLSRLKHQTVKVSNSGNIAAIIATIERQVSLELVETKTDFNLLPTGRNNQILPVNNHKSWPRCFRLLILMLFANGSSSSTKDSPVRMQRFAILT